MTSLLRGVEGWHSTPCSKLTKGSVRAHFLRNEQWDAVRQTIQSGLSEFVASCVSWESSSARNVNRGHAEGGFRSRHRQMAVRVTFAPDPYC